jgi:hypothetical protein
MEAPSSAYPRGTAGAGKNHRRRGGDLRRLYAKPHQCYGGLDRHARTMSLCLITQAGELLRHRHMQASPELFLKALAPSREAIIVAGSAGFPGTWLAALYAQPGSAFVLSPALYMQALHGGKAKHDTLDSHKIAALRRGGMLPQASVDPAALRATRDLLRRRIPLTRQRAALLAHGQQTNRQDHRPELRKPLADQANRAGVAARCPEPAVPKRVDVDLALIDSDARLLSDVALTSVQTATQHQAQTLSRLPAVPGLGQIVSLGLRDELHDLARCPRGQAFVSSCRLITCAKASAGTRDGTSGAKLGHADRPWACSEAAVLFWRHHPAGQR